MRVRTYGFPGGLTRPTGDLGLQLPPRIDHVEACRPRGYVVSMLAATAKLEPMEASPYRPPAEPHVPEGPIHPGSGRRIDWRRIGDKKAEQA